MGKATKSRGRGAAPDDATRSRMRGRLGWLIVTSTYGVDAGVGRAAEKRRWRRHADQVRAEGEA